MSSILKTFTFIFTILSIIGPKHAVAIPLEATRDHQLEPRLVAPDNFWLTSMTHGSSPYAPAGYPIFRNVKDYGAKGDGVTDDTDAINAAASAGGRCEGSCGSSTVLGAIVYFPSGTYIVKKPIFQHYYTQFIGNPNDRPILQAHANFSGIAVVDSDFYVPGGDGGEWYINQSNFYRQIRNIIFNITALPPVVSDGVSNWVPTALHWQVAQATSLYNLHFIMSTAPGNNQVGIFMENGSGGFISDLTFFGGQFGMRCGAQQFTVRDLHFTSCITAIQMIWDWTWTWKNIYIYSCWVGIDVVGDGTSEDGQPISSITVLDSYFASVPIAILTGGQTGIQIDNTQIINCNIVVGKPGGPTILAGGDRTIVSWVSGNFYDGSNANGTSFTGVPTYIPSKPASLLDSTGKFFVRSKPQYETLSASSFYNVKSAGAVGNGVADDTDAINSALKQTGKIIFFPAGIYKITSQIFVPAGSKIVGESWSQIMATGSYFSDINHPKAAIKVGNAGESGIIEMQDLIFTTKGPTPGAILMEWNIKESSQGSAAMWDCHFRVGGAVGTDLQASDCPKLTGTINPNCYGGTLMLHLTAQSSAYLENVWAWVADHDVDIPDQTQIDIYMGRGILIESTASTWFWGTASEHSVMYQYQLYFAQNVFMGLVQTETPYFQSQPVAPQPFGIVEVALDVFPSDPDFTTCYLENDPDLCSMAWALNIDGASDIYIYGVGFYSWFQDNYSQACVATENCQQRLIQTSYSEKVYIYGIATKGAQEAVSPMGSGLTPALQSNNQNGYTTSITAWLVLAPVGSSAKGLFAYPPPNAYHSEEANNLGVIRYWAAFGDSYSAGPGAGDYIQDGASLYVSRTRTGTKPYKQCFQYTGAYPFLLGETKSPFRTSGVTKWAFFSCTGARINPGSSGDPVILTEELANIKGNEDFITLSLGGNDLDFGTLANACVFAIMYTSQAECDKYYNAAIDALTVQNNLDGMSPFSRSLEQAYVRIIDAYYTAGNKNGVDSTQSWFTIFVTNYLSLFSSIDDATNCNNINFKSFPNLNPIYTPQNLNFVNRGASRVNNGANNKYANRIVVVDSDSDFGGHRFCELQTTEPDYAKTLQDDGTWFYLPAVWVVDDNDNVDPIANQNLDINVPENIDLSGVNDAIDNYFGYPGGTVSAANGFAQQYPVLVKRNWWETFQIARYSVGLTRSAHPTVAGFKTIKQNLCIAICSRFRSIPTCQQNGANIESWCPRNG
ncbi:hypothetical protein TWF694_006323 [Orbilia ellipsospora]|uniref:Rhamnogalacturonase A/B/Epimerase-like pectate lyase domain-containing protein n=1 Tax=Orbilia ellipsospora TaxID=2528407 RepID=A0AAV9XJU0_9PEZI